MLTRLRRFLRKPLDQRSETISAILSSLWIKCTAWLVYPIRLRHGIWIWTRSNVAGLNLRRDRELECAESRFVERFLKPGMHVLDIGANIGYFTLLTSRQVGAQGTVVAFEPSPRERNRLQKNLVLNHCQNVRVEQVAVCDHIGEANLFVVLGRETGCNSMRSPNVDEPIKPITVPTTTLDEYVSMHETGPIDFVKMDIEGAELSALKGARVLLTSSSRPIWLCEMIDLRTAAWGYRAVENYDFMVRLGYRWFSILPDGSLKYRPRKDHFHENLVAVPEERLPDMQALLEAAEQASC